MQIEKNFAKQYPTAVDSLIFGWDKFYRKLDSLNDKNPAEDTKYYKSLLGCNDLTDETTNICQFYLICNKLPNKANIRRSSEKKGTTSTKARRWRPSISFCRESIVLHITIPGDIEKKVKDRTEEYHKRGLRV